MVLGEQYLRVQISLRVFSILPLIWHPHEKRKFTAKLPGFICNHRVDPENCSTHYALAMVLKSTRGEQDEDTPSSQAENRR
jgi:hypothetical protein